MFEQEDPNKHVWMPTNNNQNIKEVEKAVTQLQDRYDDLKDRIACLLDRVESLEGKKGAVCQREK